MTLDHPYSILVTDDDPAVRETFRDIFEPQGYRTFLAESGEEAIDIVQEYDVHIALMDMHLPKMTGLETMAIVRQIKARLPMILISAENDEQLLRRALSANAFCVLAKPVSRNHVIYVVSRALTKFYD
jgi:CheY-like chemotaxis protein